MLLDLTKEVLVEQWSFRFDQYTANRSALYIEDRELEESRQQYLRRIGKTKNEELVPEYEEEIKKIKQRKVEIEKALNKKQYTAEQFGTAAEKVFTTLKQPLKMWKSDDYSDKRTILLMYFNDQLTYDYKTGFGTVSLDYPIKLIASIGSTKNGSVEMSGCEPESE